MRAGSGSSIVNSAGSISSGTPSGSPACHREVPHGQRRTCRRPRRADREPARRVTTPGHATILLPSRQDGDVVLPDPPGGARDLTEALRAIADGVRRRLSGTAPMTVGSDRSVPGLAVAQRGAVLTLRLERPEQRNAIDDVMMAGLIDAIDLAGRDESVRAIYLTGAGEHFCGGADVIARNADTGTRPRVGSIQRRLPSLAHRLIPLLCEVQVPVVCAVKGWAVGIGLQLAAAADFTVDGGRRHLLGTLLGARLLPRQRRDLAAPSSRRHDPGPGTPAARSPRQWNGGRRMGPRASIGATRRRRRRRPGAGGSTGRRPDGLARPHQMVTPLGRRAAVGRPPAKRGFRAGDLVAQRGFS